MKTFSPLTLVMVSVFLIGCWQSHTPSELEDPYLPYQWYLGNRDDQNVTINLDIHQQSYKGNGVVVSVIDDGMDLFHEDLADNISDLNFSFVPEGYDFTNSPHGTAVSGIIGAVANNGVGMRGIAPEANLVGINVMRSPSVSNIASALVMHQDVVDVSNNSWGDINGWGELFLMRPLILDALVQGTSQGRGGKGIVYVFAAGNGHQNAAGMTVDNTNYSGLTNSIYTIPVCAITSEGLRAPYSVTGATLVVCAPSSGGEKQIFTTDVSGELGYNDGMGAPPEIDDENYTGNFGGTSAAAPMVSGIVALMLEARPDLTWRDVKAILIASAFKINPDESGWQKNGGGFPYHHQYGFGLVDAERALSIALQWFPKGDLVFETHPTVSVQQPIPETHHWLSSSISVNSDLTIEYVEIEFSAKDHDAAGDLHIQLISPMGTVSILAEPHQSLFEGLFRYDQWRFGTITPYGELADGQWTIRVRDEKPGVSGTFDNWKISFHGTRP